MTEATTPRLALPFLQAGQAQKEMTHNEALAALDIVVQASVVAVAANDPPAPPLPGQCWIIGTAPTGAWAGHPSQLAGWTESGWRFVAPWEGMRAWVPTSSEFALFSGGAWMLGGSFGPVVVDGVQVVGSRVAPIPQPSGGTIIDTEARASIGEILLALQAHGLIAAG